MSDDLTPAEVLDEAIEQAAMLRWERVELTAPEARSLAAALEAANARWDDPHELDRRLNELAHERNIEEPSDGT